MSGFVSSSTTCVEGSAAASQYVSEHREKVISAISTIALACAELSNDISSLAGSVSERKVQDAITILRGLAEKAGKYTECHDKAKSESKTEFEQMGGQDNADWSEGVKSVLMTIIYAKHFGECLKATGILKGIPDA